MSENKKSDVDIKAVTTSKRPNGIASIVVKIVAVIFAAVVAVNITYLFRYGTLKTFGSIPYGYTIFYAVSDTVNLENAKLVVSPDDTNKAVSKEGNRIFVWTKYGSYSGKLSFEYNNRTVTVPFSLINTNNWHRNKVTLTVDIVGDDVTVKISCSSTGLDMTKYNDSALEKYKIDDIKSVCLTR